MVVVSFYFSYLFYSERTYFRLEIIGKRLKAP